MEKPITFKNLFPSFHLKPLDVRSHGCKGAAGAQENRAAGNDASDLQYPHTVYTYYTSLRETCWLGSPDSNSTKCVMHSELNATTRNERKYLL